MKKETPNDRKVMKNLNEKIKMSFFLNSQLELRAKLAINSQSPYMYIATLIVYWANA